MLLKNKTSIITGCNKGIGKEILELFAQNGSDIIACIRKESEDFDLFIDTIEKKYQIKVYKFYFDLENLDEIKTCIGKIAALKIKIDIFV